MRTVVDVFRGHLEENLMALVPIRRLQPDILATAALAHCCMLLEEIDRARVVGNDLLVGILARAHFESLLTSAWLFLGRETKVDKLAGNFKRSVRLQHDGMAKSDAEGLSLLRTIQKRNRKVAKVNQHRTKVRSRGVEIELLEPVQVPVIRLINTDLSNWYRDAQYPDVPEATLTIEEVAAALRPLAAKAHLPHGNWDATYNLLYRSWSTFAAHTTYWVLANYVRPDGFFAPINPFHPPDPDRSDVAARGLVGLTAQFAAAILEPRSVDVSAYREISQRAEQEFAERGQAIREGTPAVEKA